MEYIIAILAACVLAGICTLILVLGMNNVHTQDQAAHYTTPGGLRLTGQYERFLRRTRTRRKIQENHPSGPAHGPRP